MSAQKVYRAIGLMSGTSADGVDAALIETDGIDHVKVMGAYALEYNEVTRTKIRSCFGLRDHAHAGAAEAERLLTFEHARAVKALLDDLGLQPKDVDVVGFHGQTLTHDPSVKLTWQLGNGAMLARETEIDVVNDFRSADVAAGGQGAPFLPLYHAARLRAEKLLEIAGGPVAVLNIGGVSNVTYVNEDESIITAFDCGPGNAMMDDMIYAREGQFYDAGGAKALKGRVRRDIVDSWMVLPFFARPIPKSLDRNEWDMKPVEFLPLGDALATLGTFVVEAVGAAERLLPEAPALWMVSGGGRHNEFLMKGLSERLQGAVRSVNEYGWNGDSVEAEGFAYLAVRSLLGLPLSLPSTTGVPAPLTGGVLNKAK